MALERLSPCKVNLLLNILGKRPDGFHELETIFHPVALHDRLRFEHAASGVTLTCNNPELPVDGSNLVHRAATAFLAAAGVTTGVKLHLEKNLPIAAGLGAGSANAAQTLLGLNELFGGVLNEATLQSIAATLGSDVPFFLQDAPALGIGRGEQVEALAPFESLRGVTILLVRPGFGISTAWAYKELARHPQALNGRPGRAAELIDALRNKSLREAASGFYNSLEAPALRKFPILKLYQDFLMEQGAAVSLMSGSGSTTFALFEPASKLEPVIEKFRGRFGATDWIATAPLSGVSV